jgi:hypothetical protein
MTGEGVTTKDLFEGGQYNITFIVKVPSPDLPNIFVSLETKLEHTYLDRYWELIKHPEGADLSRWTPNLNRTEFNRVPGNWTIASYGKIQEDITIERCTDLQIELHKTKQIPQAIELRDEHGIQVGRINIDAIDAEIDAYRTLLQQKERNLALMRSIQVDPKYIELYEAILDKARTESILGFVDKAMDLLNLLPSNTDGMPPVHVPSFLETMFVPAVAGLSVAVVLVGFLFIRLRGKLGYTLKVLEDQVKDLEGVIMKASRVDKSISTRLESIRDRLKNLLGV